MVECITIYTGVGVWATINQQERQRRHAKNLCTFKAHSYCSHSCPKINLSTVRNLNITGVSKAWYWMHKALMWASMKLKRGSASDPIPHIIHLLGTLVKGVWALAGTLQKCCEEPLSQFVKLKCSKSLFVCSIFLFLLCNQIYSLKLTLKPNAHIVKALFSNKDITSFLKIRINFILKKIYKYINS